MVKKAVKPDLSMVAIFILALLAIPRVVFHDLRIVPLDSLVYTIAAIAPFVIWLGFALFRKNKRPFRDFLIVGLTFGLLLAATHQLLWSASWGENLPHVGGNLAGKLSPGVEEIVLRVAALISSLLTGAVAGVVLGAVATVAAKVRSRI